MIENKLVEMMKRVQQEVKLERKIKAKSDLAAAKTRATEISNSIINLQTNVETIIMMPKIRVMIRNTMSIQGIRGIRDEIAKQ